MNFIFVFSHFTLALHGNSEIFSPDFIVDDGSQQFKEHAAAAFVGTVSGWPSSRVIASIANNRLEATIFLNNSVSDSLFLEYGGKYKHSVNCVDDKVNDVTSPQYCSILYRQDAALHHDYDR